MLVTTDDWKNGWFEVEIGASEDEVESLIQMLQMLLNEPDQHFHCNSDFKRR